MFYSIGDKVEWNWGSGKGEGEIVHVYTDRVTCTIKGHEITRNASREEPAYFIKQSDGDEVLKLYSEIKKI